MEKLNTSVCVGEEPRMLTGETARTPNPGKALPAAQVPVL